MKILLVVLSLVTLSGCGFMPIDADIYNGIPSAMITEKGNDNYLIAFSNGNYVGQIAKKRPHGKGRFEYEDGSSYEGQVEMGVPTGIGKLIFKNGSQYEGDILNGKMHGKGRLDVTRNNESNFALYEGEFRNGTKFGTGTMVWATGAKYEGNWDGKQNGFGVYFYPKSSIYDYYEGIFKNGNKHGKGDLRFKPKLNGGIWILREYKGKFANNELHGEGVKCTLHSNSNLETVLFENGACLGGDVLIGNWFSGAKHGKFKVISDGSMNSRYYVLGQLSSKNEFFRNKILEQITGSDVARNHLLDIFEQASLGATVSEITENLYSASQRFPGIQEVRRKDWENAYLDPDLLREIVSIDIMLEEIDKEKFRIEKERQELVVKLEFERQRRDEKNAKIAARHEAKLRETKKPESSSGESDFVKGMRVFSAIAVGTAAGHYGKKQGLSQSQIDSNMRDAAKPFLTDEENRNIDQHSQRSYSKVDAIFNESHREIQAQMDKLNEQKRANELRRNQVSEKITRQPLASTNLYQTAPTKKTFKSKADMPAPYVNYRITVPGSVNVISDKNSSDVRNVRVVGESPSVLANPLNRSTYNDQQNNYTGALDSNIGHAGLPNNYNGNSDKPLNSFLRAEDITRSQKKEYTLYAEAMAFCWVQSSRWKCQGDGAANYTLGTEDTIEDALRGIECPNATNQRDLTFKDKAGLILFCEKPFRSSGSSLVQKFTELSTYSTERKVYKCGSEYGECSVYSSKRGFGPAHTKKKWTLAL